METRVASAKKEVVIGDGRRTVIIGERINPAGKRDLARALQEGNLEIVRAEALAQAGAGADILDVSVGTFGVDEARVLPRAVEIVRDAVDLPLCLDSAKPDALAAALAVSGGKPIVNSVTGEERSLAAVLPLVLRHGAVVIGLVQDEGGVPKTAEGRLVIADRIVRRAEAIGIPREDVIIDCLASALGADTASGPIVLETIRRVKQELGVAITLGASNVSFGLPDRGRINDAFVAMAMAAGANCLIADAAKILPAVLAADLALNRDPRARRYIGGHRERLKRLKAAPGPDGAPQG